MPSKDATKQPDEMFTYSWSSNTESVRPDAIPGVDEESTPLQTEAVEQSFAPGPSVPIREYGQNLKWSIDDVAAISRASGAQLVGEVPYLRKGMESRYGSGTDTVLDEMSSSANFKERNLINRFDRLFGTAAIRASGIMSEDELVKFRDSEFFSFQKRYSGKEGAPEREKTRKFLRKAVPETFKKSTKRR